MPHGDESTTTFINWAMNLISLGVIGTIGFLVKNSFSRMQTALDIIQSSLANLTGDKKAMEVKIDSLEHRVDELEDELKQMRRRP